MRTSFATSPAIALLPRAPRNASPVPWLTSLHTRVARGPYGEARYPGNCSGELIKDLLRYFQPRRVLDPMMGSGTCCDVCTDLTIECMSKDIRFGFDACAPENFEGIGLFDFIWIHPPYWRQKVYSTDSRGLSTWPTLDAFLEGYGNVIRNCASVLKPNGKFAILMGDYTD